MIPTLNAASSLSRLLDALSSQSTPPSRILVVDSQSDDGTVQIVKSSGKADLIQINRRDFDHGGTRAMAFQACDTPVVVFVTQDALPIKSDCMEKLLQPFSDERVAAVCARQVAYAEHGAAEKAFRAFRYPNQSVQWSKADTERLGIRAYLLSDVCAAYRRSAYEAVGGFAHPLRTNEDMLIAADFLDAGYDLAYQADAAVWHSHHMSLRQEYRRNRLIGQFLAQYGQRFGSSGEMGEGLKLVKYVTAQVIKEKKPGQLISFWFSCAARLLGNRAGKRDGKASK